jgi:hypothetical protein
MYLLPIIWVLDGVLVCRLLAQDLFKFCERYCRRSGRRGSGLVRDVSGGSDNLFREESLGAPQVGMCLTASYK